MKLFISQKVSLFLVLLGFIFFGVMNILVLFAQEEEISGYFFYHSCIVLFFIFLGLWSFVRFEFPQEKSEKGSFFLMGIVVSLFVLSTLRYYEIPHLWLDEYTQLIRSIKNPMQSAEEQQPPGGYVLSAFLAKVMGLSKLTARLTGLIPMTLSLFYFLVAAARASYLLPFSFLFLSFYALDSDVVYLSLEGRSVALGVMSMSLSLLSLVELIKLPTKMTLIFFFFSCYLFFTSVGLQPPFILGLLFLLNMFFLKKGLAHKYAAFALAGAGLLFSPLQLYTLKLATEAKKFNPNYLEKFKNALTSLEGESFLRYLLPDSLGYVWGIPLLVSIISVGFLLKRERRSWTILGTFFFLLFPFVFHLSFYFLVNWYLNRWYFSCFLILSSFFICFVVSRLRWFRINYTLSILSSIALLLFFPAKANYKGMVNWRPDWERVYKTSVVPGPQRIYVMGYCNEVSWWCYDIFVGLELFEKHNESKGRGFYRDLLPASYLQDSGIIVDAINLTEKVKVTVVVPLEEIPTNLDLSIQGHQKYNMRAIDKFLIFETNGPISLQDEASELLEYMILKLPQKFEYYFPYIELIWLKAYQKKNEDVKFWYNKLMNLDGFQERALKHPRGEGILSELNILLEGSELGGEADDE